MDTSWLIYDPANCLKDRQSPKLQEKLNTVPPWIQEKEDFEEAKKHPEMKDKFKDDSRGRTFYLDPVADEVALARINMALYLRKPMLVRGDPGVGKSSLAYSLAHCLGLGKVIRWPITSHSTLKDGLYRYDAIGDLSQAIDPEKKRTPSFYLGSLGQAIARRSHLPAVLLLDEIDKSDMDLPNDLLHFLEDASFQIQELAGQNQNVKGEEKISSKVFGVKFDGTVDDQITADKDGRIMCLRFPIIVMTSNEERPLSPAFLRRCITVEFGKPKREKLEKIVELRFGKEEDYQSVKKDSGEVIDYIYKKIEKGNLSSDFALQAISLFLRAERPKKEDFNRLIDELSKALDHGNGK